MFHILAINALLSTRCHHCQTVWSVLYGRLEQILYIFDILRLLYLEAFDWKCMLQSCGCSEWRNLCRFTSSTIDRHAAQQLASMCLPATRHYSESLFHSYRIRKIMARKVESRRIWMLFVVRFFRGHLISLQNPTIRLAFRQLMRIISCPFMGGWVVVWANAKGSTYFGALRTFAMTPYCELSSQ